MAATIQLCGRYIVEVDGKRIDPALPGRQGRLLFAYLVLHRDQPLDRHELVDAVWPVELPGDPADALAALLSKVRAALGGPWLAGRSELVLTLPPDADVDVERAVTAAHRAESACAQGDWPRAWSASLTAQMVTHRRLLTGCEAPWIEEWRRTLAELLEHSLQCYASACLGIGGTELWGAERAARELVRLAPLRETGYELLMRALEAQGDVAEALLVYDDLRQRLRDQLGVAPAERVQAVHRRLLGATSA